MTTSYTIHIQMIVEVFLANTLSDVLKVSIEWIMVPFLVGKTKVIRGIASFVERFLVSNTLLLIGC